MSENKIIVDFIENIRNFSVAMKRSKNRIQSMVLLKKVVSQKNIYLNESNWLYTLQINTI